MGKLTKARINYLLEKKRKTEDEMEMISHRSKIYKDWVVKDALTFKWAELLSEVVDIECELKRDG